MYTDHPYQRELTGLDPVCIRRDMLSELESKLYSVIFVLFTAVFLEIFVYKLKIFHNFPRALRVRRKSSDMRH